MLTNQQHQIVKEITYDAYGNILSDTNKNFKIPFGFAGGLHDKDTSLVHFGYREYDPHTGKWTVKDPIDFSGGDSNLYGYVRNSPGNFVDPSGLKDALSTAMDIKNGVDAMNMSHAGTKYSNNKNAMNVLDFADTIAPFWCVFDANKTKDLVKKMDNKAYKDCMLSGH